jgi:hypothetical protein
MSATNVAPAAPHLLRRLRERSWSPLERAIVIVALATVMGSLFVATYSLALGDPVPHRINAALVGNPSANARAVNAVQRVAEGNIAFQRYPSVAAAQHELDEQNVYAVLDLTSAHPTLYVASAAGASVARVLEKVAEPASALRVVDTHPLPAHDPNGLDIFYLMLVSTIVGFVTIFQILANAKGLDLRQWTLFIVGLALWVGLVVTLVDGPLLQRLDLPVLESWGILAVHVLAVASFTSLMHVLIGRWAMLPTWLFFVVLGNSSSGGAVAPPLLPSPLAFVSQWLPSGATVTAIRNAVYFRDQQHAHPIIVLATWGAALFAAMVLVSHRRGVSPGGG